MMTSRQKIGFALLVLAANYWFYSELQLLQQIQKNQNLILSNQDTIKAEQEAQRHDIILIIENQAAIDQDSFHSTE